MKSFTEILTERSQEFKAEQHFKEKYKVGTILVLDLSKESSRKDQEKYGKLRLEIIETNVNQRSARVKYLLPYLSLPAGFTFWYESNALEELIIEKETYKIV